MNSNNTEHTPLHFNLQCLSTLLTLLYAVHNEYATPDKEKSHVYVPITYTGFISGGPGGAFASPSPPLCEKNPVLIPAYHHYMHPYM